jgi:regulator of ribonuclease activity A
MEFKTADLCDTHGQALRVVETPFLSYGGRTRFHGKIETIKAFEDNSLVRDCVNESGDGKVLVVDGGGSMRRAMLGDQLAERAVEMAWAGIVVYGCIRDSGDIAKMALGVKALGTCPVKTDKHGAGERNVPLRFGGVTFHPGDYLYADEDGIVVSATPLDAPE